MLEIEPVTAEELAASWVSYIVELKVPVMFEIRGKGQFPVIITELTHSKNGTVIFAGIHQDTDRKVRGCCTINSANGRNWVRYVDTPPPK